MFKIQHSNQEKTRFNLKNTITNNPWGEINYNELLRQYTYDQIVTEVSQAQLEFALCELKELNESIKE